MMLVDEGKVRTDAPVEEYLPEFVGELCIVEKSEDPANPRVVLDKPSRPITVHDVLTHTSGLPFLSRVEKTIDARPLHEAAMSYAMSPLKFQPGTQYAYSNAGTNTVGRIIEVVSGQHYDEFIRGRLFYPLYMKDTTFFPKSEELSRLAKTYPWDENDSAYVETPIEQFSQSLTHSPRYDCPAGGLFSTAVDVSRFGQLILNGGELDGQRLLSEASVRRMTGTQTGTLHAGKGPGSGYGFCFGTDRPDPGHGPAPAGPCEHGGAYGKGLWINPDNGSVLVFMVQHAGWRPMEGADPRDAFREAAAELLNRAPPTPSPGMAGRELG